jgi:hypothetical protein
MAAPTRIYTVSDGSTDRLVRATHPSHALMHVARGVYAVRVATQEDLATLLPEGVKVEEIGQEQQELPA